MSIALLTNTPIPTSLSLLMLKKKEENIVAQGMDNAHDLT
jgi:hypothetical protein